MELLVLYCIFVALVAVICYLRLKVLYLEDENKTLRKQRDAIQHRLDGGSYWK